MAYGSHNPATMKKVEETTGSALKRWRLEDGPTPAGGFVILISPERGTNAAGIPL